MQQLPFLTIPPARVNHCIVVVNVLKMASRNRKLQQLRIIQAVILYRVIAKQRNQRELWVHPLNADRALSGEHLKVDRMYSEFPVKFFEYTRLSPQQFDSLLELVGPEITKQDTTYRLAIPARVRLYVTLRYALECKSTWYYV